MASKRDTRKLESDIRSLSQRFSDMEMELARKEEGLKNANQRKSELLSDLREYQRNVKDLKAQLERSRSAEMEAKGMTHDSHLALEVAEIKLRDKTASSKAAIISLQQEMKRLKNNLADKEDKCDSLEATSQDKEEIILSLNNEKSRSQKEWSSRLLNLNNALSQAKQACAESTEENEVLKSKEWELAQKIEDLQLASSHDSRTMPPPPCKVCQERELKSSNTPVKKPQGSSRPPPSFPGETERDALRGENKKLKQNLSCLQANFEITAQKSSQLRTQLKEMEASTLEIQNLLDSNLAEKVDLQLKLEEVKSELYQPCSQTAEKKQLDQMIQEIEKLQGEIDYLQQDNVHLKEKSRNEISKTLKCQNITDKVTSEVKNLREERCAMKNKITTLHKELGELQDNRVALEGSSNMHLETERKNSAAVSSLKLKISQLSTEKLELSRRIARASDKLDEAYIKIHSQEEDLKALEVNLKATVEENAVLSARWKERSCLPDETEGLHAKISEMMELIEKLRMSVKDHEKERERSESKISELNKNNTRLSREAKHKSDMTRKMNSEIEKLEEKVQNLESELEAKEKFHKQLQKKLNNAKLKLEREESNSVQEVVDRLTTTVKKLEADNFMISTELKSTQMEKALSRETHSEIQQKLAEFESKLDAAEFSILEKESQLSDLRCTNELMEAENSTLLSQVTSLSEMVSNRNFKMEAQQFQLVRHESEVFDILDKISELESEHGGCKRIIDSLKLRNEEQEKLQEEDAAVLRDMKDKIVSLKVELKKRNDLNKELETVNHESKERVTSLSDKNEDLIQTRTTTEARVHQLELDLKSQSTARKSAEDDFRHALKRSKDEDMDMKEKIEALEIKSIDLQFQCDGYQREKVKLKSRIMDLQAEVRELTQLTSSLEKERDYLGEQYEELKESALSVLQSDDSDCAAAVVADVTVGKENLASLTDKKMKGILKRKSVRKAFQPLQELLD